MERNIQAKLDPRKGDDVHKKKDHAFLEKKLQNVQKKKYCPVQLMGILNCTPDSFYDGGRYVSFEKSLLRAKEIIDEGADILDVGGASSRPNAPFVSEDEEKRRVIPLIKEIASYAREKNVALSIDTYHRSVAEEALCFGASVINNIYGFEDQSMRELARFTKAQICIMHMQGDPATMQKDPKYPFGVIQELECWFEKKIEQLLRCGVELSQMILDPGIGFGKTVEHNLEILQNIPVFKKFKLPILIGLSRKSFMSKILDKPATHLLSTTIALNTMTILKGADIIRVHDIKEHRDVINILQEF